MFRMIRNLRPSPVPVARPVRLELTVNQGMGPELTVDGAEYLIQRLLGYYGEQLAYRGN